MLAIRLQRHGKTHFATYRVIVQEAQRTPTSGRVVAYLGSYNPHSKQVSIDVAAAQRYLDHGAQPTTRVAKLLKESGVKLPKWVREFDSQGARKTRSPEKLRRNQPKDQKQDKSKEAVVKEAPKEAPEASESAEMPAETAETSTEAAAETESAETETETAKTEPTEPAETAKTEAAAE